LSNEIIPVSQVATVGTGVTGATTHPLYYLFYLPAKVRFCRFDKQKLFPIKKVQRFFSFFGYNQP